MDRKQDNAYSALCAVPDADADGKDLSSVIVANAPALSHNYGLSPVSGEVSP